MRRGLVIALLTTGILLSSYGLRGALSSKEASWVFPYREAGFSSVPGAPFQISFLNRTRVDEGVATNTLILSDPDGENEIQVEEGREITIEGRPFTVESIRLWSGLVATQNGQPLAAVSIRQQGGPWTENMFLFDSRWQRLEPRLAMYFKWLDDEKKTLERIQKGFTLANAARWGVLDTNRVHWFYNFSRGLSVETDEGAIVSLLEYAKEYGPDGTPAIRVGIRVDGRAETLWIIAERDTPNSPVIFEYPIVGRDAIGLFAWKEGELLAALYRDGHLETTSTLHAGTASRIPGTDFELRLESAYSSAVAVAQRDSTIHEIVLAGESERIRVRFGEAVRIEDTLLRYRRTAPRQFFAYEAEWSSDGEDANEIRVEPHVSKSIEYGGKRYTIRQLDDDPLSDGHGGLIATEAKNSHAVLIGFGVIVAACGILIALSVKRPN